MTKPGHPLDNVVWHALTGPQARFAQRFGGAMRYDPDVSPFTALPDTPDAADWDALARLLGPDTPAVIARRAVQVPPEWRVLARFTAVQMIAPDALAEPEPGREEHAPSRRLDTADLAAMTELVARTEPGPWAQRTIELGTYIGVYEESTNRRDALIAMAGERMAIDGHTEISAVCTDPEHRGRGLAGALVRTLAGQIRARGQVPFLHAMRENITAIRLYEALGFDVRAELEAVVLRAPRADRRS